MDAAMDWRLVLLAVRRLPATTRHWWSWRGDYPPLLATGGGGEETTRHYSPLVVVVSRLPATTRHWWWW